jgi:hypothetical protein
LYSIPDGVAMIVTDWSGDAALTPRYLAAGSGQLSSGFGVRAGSDFSFRLSYSPDGDSWMDVGDVGVQAWPPPQVSYHEDWNVYLSYQRTGDVVVVDESEDGLSWSAFPEPIELDPDPDGKLDVSLGFGVVIFVNPDEIQLDLDGLKLSRDGDGGGVTLDPMSTDLEDPVEYDGDPIQSVFPELLENQVNHQPIPPPQPVRA